MSVTESNKVYKKITLELSIGELVQIESSLRDRVKYWESAPPEGGGHDDLLESARSALAKVRSL